MSRVYTKTKFQSIKEAEEFTNQFKLDLISLIPEITKLDVQDKLTVGEDTEMLVSISAKELAELLHRI